MCKPWKRKSLSSSLFSQHLGLSASDGGNFLVNFVTWQMVLHMEEMIGKSENSNIIKRQMPLTSDPAIHKLRKSIDIFPNTTHILKILFDMILFQLHNIIKLHKFLMIQNPKIHHFCLQHLTVTYSKSCRLLKLSHFCKQCGNKHSCEGIC